MISIYIMIIYCILVQFIDINAYHLHNPGINSNYQTTMRISRTQSATLFMAFPHIGINEILCNPMKPLFDFDSRDYITIPSQLSSYQIAASSGSGSSSSSSSSSSLYSSKTTKEKLPFKNSLKRLKLHLYTLLIKIRYFIADILLIMVRKLVGIKGIREIGRKQNNLSIDSNGNSYDENDNNISSNSAFVYLLELEQGCYYVGSTTDVTSRWVEHQSGKGAKFTKVYKPIRIEHVEEVIKKDVAGRELRLTALAMLKYGINRVRGAHWCKAESFKLKNLYQIFPLIAHVLGLNYDEVQTKLTDQLRAQPSLPLSKKELLEKKRKQQKQRQQQQRRDSRDDRKHYVVKKASTKQNVYSTINTFKETKDNRFSETAAKMSTSSDVVENNIEHRNDDDNDNDNSNSNRTKEVAIHIESKDNVLLSADEVVISDSDDMKKSVISKKSKHNNKRSKKKSNDHKSGSIATDENTNSNDKEDDDSLFAEQSGKGMMQVLLNNEERNALREILSEVGKEND